MRNVGSLGAERTVGGGLECGWVCVAHLSLRSARNTMGTRGTPECHPGLVAPLVKGPK